MKRVIYDCQDHMASITLNWPEVMNCFNYDTLLELEAIIQDIHTDKSVRAVVITGAGPKAFSAGADLKERRTLAPQEVRRSVKKIGDVFNQVAELPQPTIAAINGYALGGGLELALACDFRYAAEGAYLGLTETSMAIIPGAGGTQRLPRLIGEAKAMELILTAKRLTAEEALQYGLVNKVVKADQLLDSCKELAAAVMKNGPIAVQQAKFAIKNGMNVDLATGLKIESKAYEVTIPTADRVEALKAFNEKRPPKFTGK
ncbi:enoyl-CoA hydratase-related protein [Pullulanibacillus sp. KACC 23026]|uniref:enoyl-CoA hydratase-related protein n=1 Tax=Pullulanibacillus sp. KACC 23026 TaxID=3028315 RepID=UPI0023AE856A|nr:enoyl-CoA hydratase-related protein [Pullulanibacillus sp. KACC 23026]WEG12005.1 enoyl-CoA hydratase-related protein [Pullulanibacillus sp. KACC 23026]